MNEYSLYKTNSNSHTTMTSGGLLDFNLKKRKTDDLQYSSSYFPVTSSNMKKPNNLIDTPSMVNPSITSNNLSSFISNISKLGNATSNNSINSTNSISTSSSIPLSPPITYKSSIESLIDAGNK